VSIGVSALSDRHIQDSERLFGELRQSPIRAVKDDYQVVAHDEMREGRGAFFVTALTCGQDTNRTHVPAVGAPTHRPIRSYLSPGSSLLGLRRRGARAALELGLVPPHSKQNPT
jgi:hypothetical protein